jgi:hypothetical protein
VSSTVIKLDAKHWIVEGELMVSFYLAGPIAPDVWQDYCDTIASGATHKLLFASIGPVEIDSTARRRINEALRARPPVAVAVVTDEAVVRGPGTSSQRRFGICRRATSASGGRSSSWTSSDVAPSSEIHSRSCRVSPRRRSSTARDVVRASCSKARP